MLQRWVSVPGPVGAAAVAALSTAFKQTEEDEARQQLLQARLSSREMLSGFHPHPAARAAGDEAAGQLDPVAAQGTEGLRGRQRPAAQAPELLALATQADAIDELAEAVEATSEEAKDDAEVAGAAALRRAASRATAQPTAGRPRAVERPARNSPRGRRGARASLQALRNAGEARKPPGLPAARATGGRRRATKGCWSPQACTRTRVRPRRRSMRSRNR